MVHIRRLGGGLAGETHAVHIRDRDDSLHKLVLKRCASQGVSIEREWLGLQVARSLQIPSPEQSATLLPRLPMAGWWRTQAVGAAYPCSDAHVYTSK